MCTPFFCQAWNRAASSGLRSCLKGHLSIVHPLALQYLRKHARCRGSSASQEFVASRFSVAALLAAAAAAVLTAGLLLMPLAAQGSDPAFLGPRTAAQRHAAVAMRGAEEPQKGGKGLPDGAVGGEFGELNQAEDGPELPFELDASLLAVIFFALVACCIFVCLNNDASLTSGQSRVY
mmetsp:Transcript_80987/g.208480  ORF Transcript_80987/g.208480 Transcript_80987/m.208480 type:complete len:178 (+) Transcript_80987:1223-1756(+)